MLNKPWPGGSFGWNIIPYTKKNPKKTKIKKHCGFHLGQVIYQGCGFHPQSGHVQEATNQCFSLTSLTFSPPPLSSLSKSSEHILG